MPTHGQLLPLPQMEEPGKEKYNSYFYTVEESIIYINTS